MAAKISDKISENELLNLAKKIGPSYYASLGNKLEFGQAELENFLIHSQQDVQKAILRILIRWNDNRPLRENSRDLLGRILDDTELKAIGDLLRNGRLLTEQPRAMSSSTETHQMPAASAVARNSSLDSRLADSPEDEVTDAHVRRLSELLNPSNFSAMHVALEIPYDTAIGILNENMNHYTATYAALLHRWKKESARTLDNLDEVLRQANVGGLISMYRDGSSVAHNRRDPERRQMDIILLDGNHAEGLFDHQGGKLSLETHGCMLLIPAGALPEESPMKITLEILTELPDDLELEGDEMVVSPGFKCLPSGLQFKKPVKLIMPHCAVLHDPGRVKTVLHSRIHESEGKIERIPLTPSTCKVHHSHFELLLQHFSYGCLTMIWEKLTGKGKWMCCMPYLPNTMPESRKPEIELRLRNKPHQALVDQEYALGRHCQPALDEDYQILIEREDLKITCDRAQEDHKTEILEYSHIFNTDRCKVAFILDLESNRENTAVTLKLTQTKTYKIIFDTGCEGQLRAMSSSTETHQMAAASATARNISLDVRLADSPEDEVADAHVRCRSVSHNQREPEEEEEEQQQQQQGQQQGQQQQEQQEQQEQREPQEPEQPQEPQETPKTSRLEEVLPHATAGGQKPKYRRFGRRSRCKCCCTLL